MRDNYETAWIGQHCVLVPYRRSHVRQYHTWMQNAALLAATASEPLTLEQEYAMQRSWRDDPHKCTAIVLARDAIHTLPTEADAGFIIGHVAAMAGDVNLFLSELDEDHLEQPPSTTTTTTTRPAPQQRRHVQAELDIMIAEPRYQRKGLGREACLLMMLYGAQHLSVERFVAKIARPNVASLALFGQLGWQQCGYAECFDEYEYEFRRPTASAMVDAVAALLGSDQLRTLACPVEEEEEEDGTQS